MKFAQVSSIHQTRGSGGFKGHGWHPSTHYHRDKGKTNGSIFIRQGAHDQGYLCAKFQLLWALGMHTLLRNLQIRTFLDKLQISNLMNVIQFMHADFTYILRLNKHFFQKYLRKQKSQCNKINPTFSCPLNLNPKMHLSFSDPWIYQVYVKLHNLNHFP